MTTIPLDTTRRQSRRRREAWADRLDLTSTGKPRPTHHNLLVVLGHHPDLVDLYALDEFAGRVVTTRPAPWGGRPGELTDADAVELSAWLGDPAGMGMPTATSTCHEAIVAAAARNPVHPVREYLDSLAWDGTDRLGDMLPDFFGAAGGEYTAAVATNWMIAAVARIHDPGCQVDIMPVLEGPQGARKSSALRLLAGDKWYAEATESPTSKDFHQALPGRWIVEIAEMQAFSRAEVPRVKQAVTTRVDVYRPSYGRVARAFPRQCVFAGTTNESEYLRDPTGARRFLPVRVRDIDLDALAAAREQLWAEAVARYRRGDPWWHLPAAAAEEQEARYQVDAWESSIAEWLDGLGMSTAYPSQHIGPVMEATVTEIMSSALGVEVARQTRQDQMRVGAILRRLGWARQRVRRGGGRTYAYVRGNGDAR